MRNEFHVEKGKREVKYLNKDFPEFRNALIEYAKNYFPNQYSDFNETSPGMMFIEMAAYVGDVLSFYTDVQLKESLLYTATENKNLYKLAQSLGYKIPLTRPSQVILSVSQIVPAKGVGENIEPDLNYALVLDANMQVSTQNGVDFYTNNIVDFSYHNELDPLEISVFEVNNEGEPSHFLLTKKVKATQGTIITKEFEFNESKKYDKIVLQEDNISHIIDIHDDSSRRWYEVDYLAQDLVSIPIPNTHYNDDELHKYKENVPYLLCYRQTERRFVTRIRTDEKLEIQFGAGLGEDVIEEILPNPINVGSGLEYFKRDSDISIDPSNFILNKSYGLAPRNTTLTVRYAVNSGLSGNVRSNTITNINDVSVLNTSEIDLSEQISSLIVNNEEPAFGGLNKVDTDLIRQEAIANFAAQNRTVTNEDYILRCYSLPPIYGSVAKAYVEHDTKVDDFYLYKRLLNQNGLNLYILSYDDNGKFTYSNEALKHNLKVFLENYRVLTDGINIKDPYIVNIGMKYDIIIRPNYNSHEVLIRCKEQLKELFHNSRMQINQLIYISNIVTELDKVEGVQTVQNFEIFNINDESLGYSPYEYSIKDATKHNIIYPSADPCIFEVKFPETDIKGRVVNV